jgi:hypothetical protein
MSHSPQNICHFIENQDLFDLLHTQNHRENAKHSKQKSHKYHTKKYLKELKEPNFGERIRLICQTNQCPQHHIGHESCTVENHEDFGFSRYHSMKSRVESTFLRRRILYLSMTVAVDLTAFKHRFYVSEIRSQDRSD